MIKNYQFSIVDLEENKSLYKQILLDCFDNNIYYSIEHLCHFVNSDDSLKFFLMEKEGPEFLVMPFVFRKLDVSFKNNVIYDVISPYGYSGPLYTKGIDKQDLSVFWSHVDQWYKENNVVTEFIRFSLSENYTSYTGKLIKTLSNVRGQLFENFEEQWNAFSSKVRNNYRKAIKCDLEFKVFLKNEITKDIVQIFFEVYTQTMSRRAASEIYFFPKTYFENLILSNLANFAIAIAYHQKKPISVELIIKNKQTIFAFLGGTDSNYYSYRPNDFLRVKIIEWAIKNKKSFYVLGGGISEKDSLYKNKKMLFPKNEDVTFFTGRKIINHEAYDMLCLKKNPDYLNIPKEDLKNYYFPFYRATNN